MKFPAALYAVQFLNDAVVKILKTGPIPQHIAIVMDGNRRFAKAHNWETSKGHTAGFETFLRIAQMCSALGIKTVTVYAFSIENFSRSKAETDKLFDMVRTSLNDVDDGDESVAKRLNWRIKVIGNRSMIPADLMDCIERIEKSTADNTGTLINVCCPYTARDDMAQAVQKCVDSAHNHPEEITESAITESLYTAESGPLDILIRTSGTTRLSDFLLWECVEGSQVEFASALWPDFGALDLYPIILRWGLRQIKNKKNGIIPLDKLPPAPTAVSVNRAPPVVDQK